MSKIVLNKNHDHKKYTSIILIAILLGMVIFGIWIMQLNSIFSVDSLNNLSVDIEKTRNEVERGIGFSRRLQAEIPGLNENYFEAFKMISTSVNNEIHRQEVMEVVAQEMIKEIETSTVETEVTDSILQLKTSIDISPTVSDPAQP